MQRPVGSLIMYEIPKIAVPVELLLTD